MQELGGVEGSGKIPNGANANWEGHSISNNGYAVIKPINGKQQQMILWQSDYSIVSMKPRNGGGEKGVAVVRSVSGTHFLHSDADEGWQQNWNIQPNVEWESITEEPCVGKPQARFCEGH